MEGGNIGYVERSIFFSAATSFLPPFCLLARLLSKREYTVRQESYLATPLSLPQLTTVQQAGVQCTTTLMLRFDESSASEFAENVNLEYYAMDQSLLSARSSRKEIACSHYHLGFVLTSNCCNVECISKLSMKTARALATEYIGLTRTDQRRHIRIAVRHGKISDGTTKHIFRLRFATNGKHYYLCAKATSLLFASSAKVVYKIIKATRSNLLPPPDRLPSLRTLKFAGNHMRAWLKRYIAHNGQFDPTSEEIFMPVRLTQAALYAEYLQSAERCIQLQKPLSIHALQKIMTNEHPNLRFPRCTGLGKCNECFHLKAVIAGATIEVERQALCDQLQQHLLVARSERLAYASRSEAARDHSSRILSITFDGATDLKFPHEYPPPRQCTNALVPILLYGTLNHTLNRRRLYTTIPCFTHNSDYVITVLALEIDASLQESGDKFDPETLYLQADNCFPQNKNVYVFFFLAILILRGYFKDIYFNFLPVGHTHDDQDAVFGMFAGIRKKRITSAPTLPDLIEKATSCDGRKPAIFKEEEFVEVNGIWSWRAYFESHPAIFPKLEGHSGYRSFHFRRTSDGVRLRYRASSVDSEAWMPVEFNADAPIIAHTMPDGIPDPLAPFDWSPLAKRVAENIGRLPASYTAEQKAWYRNFTVPSNESTLLNDPPAEALRILLPRCHPQVYVVQAPAASSAPLAPIRSHRRRKMAFQLYAARYAKRNEFIAVFPDAEQSTDTFWLAKVMDEPDRLNVIVQWMEACSSTDEWQLLRNQQRISRKSIICSGFEMPDNRLQPVVAHMIREALESHKQK